VATAKIAKRDHNQFKANQMKHLIFRTVCTLALCVPGASTARAEWIRNADAGPHEYTEPLNWNGGAIDHLFSTQPADGLNVTFNSDFTLDSQLTLAWGGTPNVTFRSDNSTPRTLILNGGIVKTNNQGGSVTFGTEAYPLIIDLNGATRQLGGLSGLGTANGTMDIYAQIIDSSGGEHGVNLSGARVFTYLRNDNNSFVGPVRFNALRGGGFTSIKNIGEGPSAFGAPTDAINGTITLVDNTSFGGLYYLGTGGHSTDRPFVWNMTGNQYSFENRGTGKITFTGPWTLPNRLFTINASSNHIQLDGYLKGLDTTNHLVLRAFSANTNQIILTCPTNDFPSLEITNVVVAFDHIADAGLPSALGTSGTILHRGNAGTSAAQNRSGQGATLQYFGPSATFTRVIELSGTGYNWGLANATNSTLTFATDWVGASTGGGFTPRYIHLGVHNHGTIHVEGVIPNVAAGIDTTVVIGNAVGVTLFNGGTVRLSNPANSFSGGLQAKWGRTVEVSTMADTGQESSIGTGIFMPTGMTGITLGSTDSQRGGILAYVGVADASCNRQFTVLGSGQGGASGTILNNSPNHSSLHLTDTGMWNFHSAMSNCVVNLGGSAIATNVLDASIPNTTLGNAHLTVNGSIWKLTASHSYLGRTTVTNGTLLLEGSIGPGEDVTVYKNGTLAGDGTINNNVIVETDGTLSPGASIGTLTLNGNLTNRGSIVMELNKTAGTRDQIVGVGTLVYGGNLLIANLSGTLAAGDSLKLFDAAEYQGAFDSIEPAFPGTGLQWNTSELATTGTLKVEAGTAEPPRLSFSLSGAQLTLSWPPEYTGFRLEGQTNSVNTGLSTNWGPVPGVVGNEATIAINPANGAVFFRLVNP
jgi:hypothetical protein